MYTLEQNLEIFQLWCETKLLAEVRCRLNTRQGYKSISLLVSVQHLQICKYIELCSILK